MATTLTTAAVLGVILTSALAINDLRSAHETIAPVKSMPSISGSGGERYVISSASGSAFCSVMKAPRSGSGPADVRMAPNCDAIMPGLSKARFWNDTEDGSVSLASSSGALLRFTLADGTAYETFEPGAPLLSMTFED